MNKPKASGVILAAGVGKRMGARKQFLSLGGKPLIAYSLHSFDQCAAIDEIILVCQPEDIYQVQFTVNRMGLSKLKKVVVGGDTRHASSRNGVRAVKPEAEFIAIHDAARPLVSPELIERLIMEAEKSGAVVPGLPLKDTVKFVTQNDFVFTTPRRESLRSIQTPQVFRASLIKKAFEMAEERGWTSSDDASMVEKMGASVKVISGEEDNIKITTPEDLDYLEFRLRKELNRMPRCETQVRVGLGFDVHRLGEGRKLVLGGVEIPAGKGLIGHSDGDVVCHALMDAMLGAAGMKDIGQLFPNDDPAYKDAYSLELVSQVASKLAQKGYSLDYADMTILAEEPALAPHYDEMQKRLASAVGVSPDQISVKATTSEGMGFVGRGEGMCCWCVAGIRFSQGEKGWDVESI